MACGSSDEDVADNVPPNTSTTGARDSGSTAGGAITLELVADNLKFDKCEMTAPAETTVTLVLKNQDVGVPHNIAIYESEDAKSKIFAVPVVSGPDDSTGEF